MAGDGARMAGSVVVQDSPFRLQVLVDNRNLLQQSSPILVARPDGNVDELIGVISRREEGDTTVYDVRTQSRAMVSVVVTSGNGSSIVAVTSSKCSCGLRSRSTRRSITPRAVTDCEWRAAIQAYLTLALRAAMNFSSVWKQRASRAWHSIFSWGQNISNSLKAITSRRDSRSACRTGYLDTGCGAMAQA